MGIIRRHLRFLVAFGVGIAIWLVSAALPIDAATRMLLAVNGYLVVYLGLMLRLTIRTTPDDLRSHSEADDEGSALILLLALATVVVSLTAIFLVLNRQSDGLTEALFALASAPLGWALMHVLAAFHYARLYYMPTSDAVLIFPDGPKFTPGVWDFLYFSFTLGICAQVSDVQVTTTAMRKTVLLHSVGSFFYNTVILALAINAGLALSN